MIKTLRTPATDRRTRFSSTSDFHTKKPVSPNQLPVFDTPAASYADGDARAHDTMVASAGEPTFACVIHATVASVTDRAVASEIERIVATMSHPTVASAIEPTIEAVAKEAPQAPNDGPHGLSMEQ